MRHIYKYEIGFDDTVITLPVGAKIRHAGTQYGQSYLWAEEVTDSTAARKEDRVFRIFATGEEIPALNWSRWEWCATWQYAEFVWHLFEKVKV